MSHHKYDSSDDENDRHHNNMGGQKELSILETIVPPSTPKLQVIDICETITKSYASKIIDQILRAIGGADVSSTSPHFMKDSYQNRMYEEREGKEVKMTTRSSGWEKNDLTEGKEEEYCPSQIVQDHDYYDGLHNYYDNHDNNNNHHERMECKRRIYHPTSHSSHTQYYPSHSLSHSSSSHSLKDLSSHHLYPSGGLGGRQVPHYIFLNIHCNGGSIYESFRIVDAIKRAKRYCIVGTIINSIAFSTAGMIFASGSDGFRFVSSNAHMMIHQPRVVNSNNNNNNNNNSHYGYHEDSRELKRATFTTSSFSYSHPGSSSLGSNNSNNDNITAPTSQHLEEMQEQIIDTILHALSNKPKQVVAHFSKDVEKHKDDIHGWFINADLMLQYGLADFIDVPDIVHKYEYRPVLQLSNGISLNL